MHRKAATVLQAAATKAARRTPSKTTYVPRTELGRRLWSIRQRIIASGQRLLDWEGLEAELRDKMLCARGVNLG